MSKDDRFGNTSFGDTDAVRALSEERPFQAGTRVRVTCLRTRGPMGERVGELGSGKLVEAPAVGSPLRIEMQSGPALVTSPVRSLVGRSVHSIQAITVNSDYRLERLSAADTPSLPARNTGGIPVDAAEAAAISQPVLELDSSWAVEEAGTTPAPPAPDASEVTGYIALTELDDRERAPFEPVTKVRILRRRSSSAQTRGFEALGEGQILDPLSAGQPARLAVEGKMSFVTSPVQQILLVDSERLEFETANTVYRLERLDAD